VCASRLAFLSSRLSNAWSHDLWRLWGLNRALVGSAAFLGQVVRHSPLHVPLDRLRFKHVGSKKGAVRSQTGNGVWGAVGGSNEHPRNDQRKRAQSSSSSWRSAFFCCFVWGLWCHVGTHVTHQAGGLRDLISMIGFRESLPRQCGAFFMRANLLRAHCRRTISEWVSWLCSFRTLRIEGTLPGLQVRTGTCHQETPILFYSWPWVEGRGPETTLGQI